MTNLVDINLEEHTAMLEMPFISMTASNTEILGEMVSHFSKIKESVVRVDDMRIHISINVDFANFISKELWTIFEGGLWDMVNDMGGIPRELREQQHEAIFKAVQNAYPKVAKFLKTQADEIIEQWNS